MQVCFLLSVSCRALRGGAVPAAAVGSGGTGPAFPTPLSLGAWLPSVGARWLRGAALPEQEG